jgi:GT2 family glycosyltransferase
MASALPRIGVVVLNWNGLAHLRECLPSLLACDYADRIALVADNASRDGSADWVEAHYPNVRVLRLPANLRFAGGNNAGAQALLAQGADVVLLLNNDTTVDPGMLRALGSAFAADPALQIAGPRICYSARPDRIWYGGGEANLWLGLWRHRALRARTTSGRDPAGPTDWVTGCALAVRAQLWSALGGLDDGFYIYGEDADFCLRARARGARIAYVPQAVVYHKVSASVGGHASAFKVYHKSRAAWRLLARHARPWQWPTAAPALVLREALLAGWLLLRGSPRSALAQAEAWRDGVGGGQQHPVAD